MRRDHIEANGKEFKGETKEKREEEVKSIMKSEKDS
jgi:hypothetical protein